MTFQLAGGFGGGGLQDLLPTQSSSPSVEQIVDYPVPRGRGGAGGGGFLPEQNSTASFPELFVDTPVRSGGLHNFHPRQSSRALAEQIVDFPVPGGIPHPDTGLAASSAVSRDEAFQGGFRTFLQSQRSAESAEKILQTFVKAVEVIPRFAATSSSEPGPSSSGASDHSGNYGGDPAYRGAG